MKLYTENKGFNVSLLVKGRHSTSQSLQQALFSGGVSSEGPEGGREKKG